MQKVEYVITYQSGRGWEQEWSIDGGIPYPYGETLNPSAPGKDSRPSDYFRIQMSDGPNATLYATPFDRSFDWYSPNYELELLHHTFEACAVCLEGKEAGATYGCVKWGQHIKRSPMGYKIYRYMENKSDTSLGGAGNDPVILLGPGDIDLKAPSSRW